MQQRQDMESLIGGFKIMAISSEENLKCLKLHPMISLRSGWNIFQHNIFKFRLLTNFFQKRNISDTLKYKSDVESLVSQTRNLSSDTINMFEVLTDIFPGIQECIFDNLTVRESCTNEGLIIFKSNNLLCLTRSSTKKAI